MMRVVVERDPAAVAGKAADLVEDYLCATCKPALGLATGGSVEKLYQELVFRYRQGRVTFGGTSAFLLDDYVGLGRGHPQRYSNVIRSRFADQVDLDPRLLHSPDGDAPDLHAECARYEELVGGAQVGLQILGIGRNGHLAFNEPGSALRSRTRVVRLEEVTRADNARYFSHPEDVPHYAITQGLATIGQASRLVLLATGSAKAEAVRAALDGPLSPLVPASVIRRHPRLTVILDQLAAHLTRFPRSAGRARTQAAGS